LVADTKRFLLSKEIQQEINDIANHLIASLFYYEKQTSSRPDENYISCQGKDPKYEHIKAQKLQAQFDVVFSLS